VSFTTVDSDGLLPPGRAGPDRPSGARLPASQYAGWAIGPRVLRHGPGAARHGPGKARLRSHAGEPRSPGRWC
jgi:hypothetical protein